MKSKVSMVIVGAVKKSDVSKRIKTIKGKYNNNNDKNNSTNGDDNDSTNSVHDINIDIETKPYTNTNDDDNILNKSIHFVVLVGNVSRPFQSLQSQLTTHSNSNSNISPFKYSIDNGNDNDNDIFIDPSPYQIVYTSQLSKVDTVFRTLKLNHAFVTETGRLTGIVTRESLRAFIGSRQKHPTERLKQLLRSVYRYCFTSQQYTPIN